MDAKCLWVAVAGRRQWPYARDISRPPVARVQNLLPTLSNQDMGENHIPRFAWRPTKSPRDKWAISLWKQPCLLPLALLLLICPNLSHGCVLCALINCICWQPKNLLESWGIDSSHQNYLGNIVTDKIDSSTCTPAFCSKVSFLLLVPQRLGGGVLSENQSEAQACK